jgi:peptidoglycan/xylan/chitin deacetylase (PgdA/CDA1 family)
MITVTNSDKRVVEVKDNTKNMLAFILYYTKLIYFIRELGKNNAKILVYHSISDNEDNFVKGTDIWTPITTFERHLKYIIGHYRVISLKRLVESLNENKILRRSVVITMDDGFGDNFYFAYPYLKKYNIEATIFLVTDCISKKKPIWIQELNYLINSFGVESIVRTVKKYIKRRKHRCRNLEKVSDIKSREGLENYFAYCVSNDFRENLLGKIYGQYDLQKEKIFSETRVFLDGEQIEAMRTNKTAFGNHGATHTPLSVMSLLEQKDEIVRSKKVMEETFGCEFLPFAYPFGQKRDFTLDTMRIVKNAGHSCIVSTMPTLNRVDTSPYDLGRIPVSNIPVFRLAFEMEKGILKQVLGKR